MVDANANDAVDGDCFVHCPALSKTKGRPKQKRINVEKNWESKRELVGFVSMLAKHLYMSEEGEGKLNFLKWCKENEKVHFNRYGIEPNILFEILGILLKKSPI